MGQAEVMNQLDDFFGLPTKDWEGETFGEVTYWKRPPAHGLPHTEETKKQLSKMKTGVSIGPHTEEAKENMRVANRKRSPYYHIVGHGIDKTMQLWEFCELTGASRYSLNTNLRRRNTWKGYTFTRVNK